MLCLSHAYLCSEHFAECDFVNFMAEYQMGLLQSGICRTIHRVTDLEKIQFESPRMKLTSSSAQHDTKNWEIHWYPETSANKAKTKSLTRMPTAEKSVKEKDYTNAYGKERKNRLQMPVAKKERPNHKCWWQTKNGCPNQAGKQLTPNERTKTAETTWNPKRLPICKHKVEITHTKNSTKSQQSNRLLS